METGHYSLAHAAMYSVFNLKKGLSISTLEKKNGNNNSIDLSTYTKDFYNSWRNWM